MPYIHVITIDEGVTNEQRQAIEKGCTKLMADVLNKSSATTLVHIDVVDTNQWGIGFDQVAELRKQASP